MNISFTRHARDKFEMLERHGFLVTDQQVREALQKPDLIDDSRLPLLIAQKSIDRDHVLRVVYKQEGNIKIVITFYPGRKRQYG